jgi:hypothetical protein
MGETTSLKETFDMARTYAEGVTQEYRGYELTKVETPGLSPDHSEWALYNRQGVKVESYTLEAFDDFQTFKDRLDELINYDPDSLQEWLDHRREQREN